MALIDGIDNLTIDDNDDILFEDTKSEESKIITEIEPSKVTPDNNSFPSKTPSSKIFLPIKKTIYKRKKYLKKKSYYGKKFIYNNNWDEENDENIKDQEDIPTSIDSITFTITPNTVIYIEDALNIYSSVYKVKNIKYNGMNFKSVDEGYQFFKLIHFCNQPLTNQFIMKSNTSQKRTFVKASLARNGIGRENVIKWRHDKGLKIIFDLTLQKFLQNRELLQKMINDKDKIILNVFGEDNYDACGKIEDLQGWLYQMDNQVIRLPCMINQLNIKILPKISTGKNIQGFIVMMVRKFLEDNGWK